MEQTVQSAREFLSWAEALNPGPWVAHSRGVARAARAIGEACRMDAQACYIAGLMHDLGRFEGVRGLHHAVAGHEVMLRAGWADVARICLTHSFPLPKISCYMGVQDVSEEERALVERALERPMDDLDRLIQLCDALAWGEGVCLIEKRLVDVVLRHGAPPDLREKWRALFDIRAQFERRLGHSLYALFPEAVENTFS